MLQNETCWNANERNMNRGQWSKQTYKLQQKVSFFFFICPYNFVMVTMFGQWNGFKRWWRFYNIQSTAFCSTRGRTNTVNKVKETTNNLSFWLRTTETQKDSHKLTSEKRIVQKNNRAFLFIEAQHDLKFWWISCSSLNAFV